jgi:hypothetical protein
MDNKMKRVINIKDSIMMPPPKARPKSRSDTSEELKRNLIETFTNTSDNSALQEGLQKFCKEMEELDNISKKNDDELSNTGSLHNSLYCYNNFINGSHCSHNHNCYNNENKETSNNLKFNFVNYHYNSIGSDDEENTESRYSVEKLKKNMSSISQEGKSSNIKEDFSSVKSKITQLFKPFKKLPPPNTKSEIKAYVNNICSYINQHEFDTSLSNLKIRLQTRFNDFKNQGLKEEYFKDCLEKMQGEVISRICMMSDFKKIEDGNNNIYIFIY